MGVAGDFCGGGRSYGAWVGEGGAWVGDGSAAAAGGAASGYVLALQRNGAHADAAHGLPPPCT